MRFVIFFCLISLTSSELRAGGGFPNATVAVYEFRGEVKEKPDIGKEIAAIFAYDIWGWFRNRDKNKHRSEFGNARIDRKWNSRLPPDDGLLAKIKSDVKDSADVVVWGDIHEITQGKVLGGASLLFIDNPNSHLHFVWSIPLIRNGTVEFIKVDFPKKYYSFAALRINEDFINQYEKAGGSDIVRTGECSGKIIPNFGPAYRDYSDGNCERVQNYYCVIGNRKLCIKGWKYQPIIVDSPIGTFAGGVLRLLRSDWQGAIEALDKMLEDINRDEEQKSFLPKDVQIDTTLHILRAKSELGLDATPEVMNVLKMAPSSPTVIKYIAMHYIGRCFSNVVRLRRAGCSKNDKERFRNLIRSRVRCL